MPLLLAFKVLFIHYTMKEACTRLSNTLLHKPAWSSKFLISVTSTFKMYQAKSIVGILPVILVSVSPTLQIWYRKILLEQVILYIVLSLSCLNIHLNHRYKHMPEYLTLYQQTCKAL